MAGQAIVYDASIPIPEACLKTCLASTESPYWQDSMPLIALRHFKILPGNSNGLFSLFVMFCDAVVLK
jgi:hypothetical protein